MIRQHLLIRHRSLHSLAVPTSDPQRIQLRAQRRMYILRLHILISASGTTLVLGQPHTNAQRAVRLEALTALLWLVQHTMTYGTTKVLRYLIVFIFNRLHEVLLVLI